ncbi:hypothetical protein GH733_009431, partial [Mirounga leonina]
MPITGNVKCRQEENMTTICFIHFKCSPLSMNPWDCYHLSTPLLLLLQFVQVTHICVCCCDMKLTFGNTSGRDNLAQYYLPEGWQLLPPSYV